ncbi:MAG: RodZ domain-containing protein [Candidatus Puniceispirillaceae bacterium]
MDNEAREESVLEDSFNQIGADLNAARLACGVQISELSQLLRISKLYLKNIETGDFDAMPGPTYVAGYLRSFAQEVGLDGMEVTQRYRALLGEAENRPAYKFPVDTQRPQRSGAMLASIIVIFAVAGYGGWYAIGKPDVLTALTGESQSEVVALPQVESTMTEPDDMGKVDEGPVELAAAPAPTADPVVMPESEAATTVAASTETTSPLAAPTAPETVETAEAAMPLAAEEAPEAGLAAGPSVETARVETARVETARVETDSAVPPLSATSEETAPADAMMADSSLSTSPTAPPAPALEQSATELAATENAGDGVAVPASAMASMGDRMDSQAGSGVAFARQRVPDMEITLRATGVSWIEIIRNDGEEVMTKLMRAGETYMVDSRDRLYLSTGNAGGLELVFNDGTVRSVGDSGQILRDLLLDAAKLRNQF